MTGDHRQCGDTMDKHVLVSGQEGSWVSFDNLLSALTGAGIAMPSHDERSRMSRSFVAVPQPNVCRAGWSVHRGLQFQWLDDRGAYVLLRTAAEGIDDLRPLLDALGAWTVETITRMPADPTEFVPPLHSAIATDYLFRLLGE